jgi:hypothetical protein
MKRIYYLLAFIAVAAGFSACNPMDNTYKQLGSLPKPVTPATTFSVTLAAADYGLLPKGHAAKTALSFQSTDTAKVDVPLILAAKYPTYGEKSSASVTYALSSPIAIKLADSLNADVAFTLSVGPPSDYTYPALNGRAANTFNDLSATAVINWLYAKFPTPAANELHVLTYLYFESGKTASSGTTQTDAFLYLNGAWVKIYRISNAQYASTNNGLNNWYVANDQVNLPAYFNTFLKADPTVMLTAKFGDIMYINYRYLTTYQRVMELTYDGTNWVNTTTPLTLSFVKTNGVWVADNTVSYTLTTADMKSIGTAQTTVASANAVANLASFGNYNIQGGATTWTDDQIATSIAVFLKTKYPTAALNQKFVITYAAYNGANITPKKTFNFDGTNFVLVP